MEYPEEGGLPLTPRHCRCERQSQGSALARACRGKPDLLHLGQRINGCGVQLLSVCRWGYTCTASRPHLAMAPSVSVLTTVLTSHGTMAHVRSTALPCADISVTETKPGESEQCGFKSMPLPSPLFPEPPRKLQSSAPRRALQPRIPLGTTLPPPSTTSAHPRPSHYAPFAEGLHLHQL